MVATALLDKELAQHWTRDLQEQKKPVPGKLILSIMDQQTHLRLLQGIAETRDYLVD